MLLPNPMGFHVFTYISVDFFYVFVYEPGPSKECQMVVKKGINSTFLRVQFWHPFGRCW